MTGQERITPLLESAIAVHPIWAADSETIANQPNLLEGRQIIDPQEFCTQHVVSEQTVRKYLGPKLFQMGGLGFIDTWRQSNDGMIKKSVISPQDLESIALLIDTDPNLKPYPVESIEGIFIDKHQAGRVLEIRPTLVWDWGIKLRKLEAEGMIDLGGSFIEHPFRGTETIILIERKCGLEWLEVMQNTRGRLRDLLVILEESQRGDLNKWLLVTLKGLAKKLMVGEKACRYRIKAAERDPQFRNFVMATHTGNSGAYFAAGLKGKQYLADIAGDHGFHDIPEGEFSRSLTVARFARKTGVNEHSIYPLLDSPEMAGKFSQQHGKPNRPIKITPDGTAILLDQLKKMGPMVCEDEIPLGHIARSLGINRPHKYAGIIERERPHLVVRKKRTGGGGYGNIFINSLHLEEAKFQFVELSLGCKVGDFAQALITTKPIFVRALVNLANNGIKPPELFDYDRRGRPITIGNKGKLRIENELFLMLEKAVVAENLPKKLQIFPETLKRAVSEVAQEVGCGQLITLVDYKTVLLIPQAVDLIRGRLAANLGEAAVASARLYFSSVIEDSERTEAF